MAVEKVAFIIVCWNNKVLLDECLSAIKAQTYQHKEIYIIDNASTDGSAEYIAEHYPDVHFIRSKHNNGFAKGNNILIKKALEDKAVKYLALVNTDAILDPDWTTILVDTAKKKPKVAALQGITLDYFNHNLIDSHHVYVADNFQSVQYGYKELYDEKAYFTRKVMGVNAAAAIYTREFADTQPFDYFFDESFFMYLEDVDISLRALMLGWDNMFVAGAKAYHMGSASSKKRSSDFSLYYTARNQFSLLCKNFPASIIWKYAGKTLKFEIRFRRHLKKEYGKKTARVYARGRLVGLFRGFLYFKKRATLSALRKISAAEVASYMENKGQ